jgi:enoyl-CoA hydratase/carnithine racemase
MSDLVQIQTGDGVMTITMARPDKKNALTGAMYQAMTGALGSAAEDSTVRVVLIQGSGSDFTAGNDLSDFAAVAAGGSQPRALHAIEYLRALAAFEKPVVAAVRGVAVGIGLTMLLHCDLVCVAEDARLSCPFGALGLTPEAGSSLLLPALIGHVRAFSLFTLGEVIDGRAAAAMGLANIAVPAADVQGRALGAAKILASRSPEAMRVTKALMRRPAETIERINVELEEFEKRLRSPEAAAAFAAFAQKSKAS